MTAAASEASFSPVPAMEGLPRHVAIIMDGNGRWAKKRFLPRTFGHKAGASTTKRVIKEASALKIEYLTLYAFSSENWKRPLFEVNELMKLLRSYLMRELGFLQECGVRVRFIGEREGLPSEILLLMKDVSEQTAHNTGTVLTIAINYGSRREIACAIQKMIPQLTGTETTDEIVEALEGNLMTAGTPPPDLMIRTSGEQRISNFLLWQMAYAEMVFTPVLWPDFTEGDFRSAVFAFAQRERRYGGV